MQFISIVVVRVSPHQLLTELTGFMVSAQGVVAGGYSIETFIHWLVFGGDELWEEEGGRRRSVRGG